jgi:hypothetical protein
VSGRCGFKPNEYEALGWVLAEVEGPDFTKEIKLNLCL